MASNSYHGHDNSSSSVSSNNKGKSSPIPVSGSGSSSHHHDGHRKFEDIFRNLIKWGSPSKYHSHHNNNNNASSSPSTTSNGTAQAHSSMDEDVQGRARSRSLDINYTTPKRILRRRRLSGDPESVKPPDISQTHQTYTIYESIIQEGA